MRGLKPPRTSKRIETIPAAVKITMMITSETTANLKAD